MRDTRSHSAHTASGLHLEYTRAQFEEAKTAVVYCLSPQCVQAVATPAGLPPFQRQTAETPHLKQHSQDKQVS